MCICVLGCDPAEPSRCPRPEEPSFSASYYDHSRLTELPSDYFLAHLESGGARELEEVEYDYERVVETVVEASLTLDDEAAALAHQQKWLTPLQEAYARGLEGSYARSVAAGDDIAWQVTEMRFRMQSHPSWFGPRFDARAQLELESKQQLVKHRARLAQGEGSPEPGACIAAALPLGRQELVENATWHFAPDAQIRVGCRLPDTIPKLLQTRLRPQLSARVRVGGPSLETKGEFVFGEQEIAVETRDYAEGDYVEFSFDLREVARRVDHGYGHAVVILRYQQSAYGSWMDAGEGALLRFSFG